MKKIKYRKRPSELDRVKCMIRRCKSPLAIEKYGNDNIVYSEFKFTTRRQLKRFILKYLEVFNDWDRYDIVKSKFAEQHIIEFYYKDESGFEIHV